MKPLAIYKYSAQYAIVAATSKYLVWIIIRVRLGIHLCVF